MMAVSHDPLPSATARAGTSTEAYARDPIPTHEERPLNSRTTRPRLTIVALLLTVFLAAAETTVVSTAMPTVIGDLGGVRDYAWVFAIYMLGTTITVPIWGKLSDLYGRKPVLLAGLVLFLVGSTASGASPSMQHLLVARGLQGLGAGAVQPVAQTILGDLFEPRERARMQGFFGAVWGMAGLLGPVLGGFIVQHLSWRWVFFINLPFGVGALVVLSIAFHEPRESAHRDLDFAGAVLLTGGVIGLLCARTHGPGLFGWPAAIVCMGALVFVERRVAEPILPLDTLGQPVMVIANLGGALLGAVMMATATFVPLLVQGLLGGNPTEAGMSIAPMAIGWPLASAVAGHLLPRIGYRPLVRTGFAVSFAASVFLALVVGPHASIHGPRLASFFMGVGLGLANTTLLLAVQSSVGWQRRGSATASMSLARTLGGTLGVGILGALLTSQWTSRTSVSESAASSLLGPLHGRDLPPDVTVRLVSALSGGLRSLFWATAALAGCAFVCALFFPALRFVPGAKGRGDRALSTH